MEECVLKRKKMLVMLKVELFRRGISQRDLAHAIGTTPARVSRMLHGHQQARARDRRRIAKFLGVREDQIFAAGKERRPKGSGATCGKSGVKRQNMGTRRDGAQRAALTESQTCQRRLKRAHRAVPSKPGKE